MTKRPIVLTLIAVALGLGTWSLVELAWFRGPDVEVHLLHSSSFVYRPGGTAYTLVTMLVLLSAIYYATRIANLGAGLLVGRLANHTLAWHSRMAPARHGALVLGCAIAALFVAPEMITTDPDLLPYLGVESLVLEHGTGNVVLIGALGAALLAVGLVARDPLLAAEQGWLVEPSSIIEDPEPPRRERPMIRPPLSGAPVGIDANPFRAGPRLDLRTKVIQTARPPAPAPVVVDPAAPPPKLLS